MKAIFEVAAACVFCGMLAPSADAHEFWIDGILDQKSENLSLDLKVGQHLEGISLPYIPETVDVFEMVSGEGRKITGRIGDVPSAQVPFNEETGAIVFHRATPRRLIHKDWALFLRYLDMEGLENIAAQHDTRGLPRTGFAEEYARHAKLLVLPNGDPNIQDRYLGSPIEFVAETVQRIGASVQIKARVVTPLGASQSQVTIFAKGPSGVQRQTILPDAKGQFDITLGDTDTVLLNAVAMRAGLKDRAAWRSDWASMKVEFSGERLHPN